MTEKHFWSLIDQARAGTSASASPERLQNLLRSLPDGEVLAFGHMFYEKLCDLNQRRLWDAGDAIAHAMSSDSFRYFRSWLVGKGREVYDLARKTPEKLGPFLDDREVDNELLEYAAIEVLQERGIKEDPRERSKKDADDKPASEIPEDQRVAKYAKGVKIHKVPGKEQWFVVDYSTPVPPADAADSPKSFHIDEKGKYRLKSILLSSEQEANKIRDAMIGTFKHLHKG
jgi:hypothetical protein